MLKKVLVVMATFNGEKYLSEQLDSIFFQRNVDVSLLVRDDGSTDKTQEILNEYQSKGLLQWYTGKHLNVAKGYFDLMQKASKFDVDYFSFSDQDDVWDSDKLMIAINALDVSESNLPKLYYCGQRLVDKDLKFLGDHRLNEKRSLLTRFLLSDFAGCTGVFNKELLNEILKYQPSYMLMHDTWILKVCLALGGIVIVDSAPHMNYRQHGSNAVGLGKNFKSNLKQVHQYLYEYKVEEQMQELIKGYGNRIIPEYKTLAEYTCSYKNDNKIKRKLLDKNYINFYNKGLNMTYHIKVFLNLL